MNLDAAIQHVRDVYVNFPRLYEKLQSDLKNLEMEQQDLLHLIEFKAFNASDGYKYSKDLQRVRNQRREIKNNIELLKPIMELNKYQQKPSDKIINKALGDVRRITNEHGERTYKMRVRDDLQELIK
ncbi:hypothetical protein [Bacillus sp. JJ722]|uniref:hypothetical protein n=1 Tax=Bacillus sp. JJ722 TaxID=3122973 RepID=UPI002FFEC8AF